MKKKSLVLVCCLVFMSLSLVACGKKEESATDILPEETQEVIDNSSNDYADPNVETDSDGNIIETTPSQNLTVKLNVDSTVEDTGYLPVDEFKKYGKIIKTKEGYRILTQDGVYLSEAIINYEDSIYYFNEDGYLTDNVFLPAKNSEGKVVTYFIHNYQYTFGLVEVNNSKFYIDENKGKVSACSVDVDGKTYYFDDNGKSIGKKTYELKYSSDVIDETEANADVADETTSAETEVADETSSANTETEVKIEQESNQILNTDAIETSN